MDDDSKSSTRTYPAELQGKVIQCNQLADAIIISFAEHALSSHGESPYNKRTLQKIAGIGAVWGSGSSGAAEENRFTTAW